MEILSWSPFIKVRFTKWKLFLWYWCIIAYRRRYTSVHPSKFYFMNFSLLSCTKMSTLSFFSFRFSIFFFKLWSFIYNNCLYLRLFSYGSSILCYFFNDKNFIYAIEILSWSPSTQVWFTKWKLYQSYCCIISWRCEVHISRPYILLPYAFFFIFKL